MKKILIALLAIVTTVGCNSNKPIEQAPQAVQAERIEARGGEAGNGLRFSAVVTPDAQVPLAFRIPGYVVDLKQLRGVDGRMRDFAEGDRVPRGTVLVRIRAAEYQDRVRQASSQAAAVEAVVVKAKFDYDRATRLYSSQSITKPEFEAAQAQYDAAQHQLSAARAATSEAQVSLADTAVVAPWDSDVVKKAVEPGAFVGPGVPVVALAKTDVVKIVIGVPDTAVQSIKLGQKVDVTVDAFANRNFEARITRIASAADQKTRNFEVEVAIPNRDHLLKVGMIGSLQLPGAAAQQEQAAVRVPLSAIVQPQPGKYGVYVAASSSTGTVARLRTIEIGDVTGSEINVLRGLSAGDEVITTGATLLKDGQRVEVVK